VSYQPVNVETSEATPEPVEPVAPCTRWQFEAIAAPIVKLAKAIVKANDPERRGDDCPEPLTGSDTFEIREAILAHASEFAYWWSVGEGMQRSVVDFDDAMIAPMFLCTHKSRMDRSERGEADPNDHPTVCAARSHLQASMIHDDWTAILERTPFKALVLTSGKGKTNLRVDFEDQCWYADALKLRSVVRTLDSLRCRDWTVRIDWNRGWNGRAPRLTFTWHDGKGRLRFPMTIDAPWTHAPTVSFTADRTVGRAFESVEDYCKAHPYPIVPIQPAGEVPANESARVACKKVEQPMSETTTTKATAPTTPAPVPAEAAPIGNPLTEADLHKWSLSAGHGKNGQAWVTICSTTIADKSTPIGKGKGATLVEAYAAAVKNIGQGEF
jgi:hypothetical protein